MFLEHGVSDLAEGALLGAGFGAGPPPDPRGVRLERGVWTRRSRVKWVRAGADVRRRLEERAGAQLVLAHNAFQGAGL